MKNIKILYNFNLRLIYFNYFDIEYNNFCEIDNTWWQPCETEMCSEEERWQDYELHLGRKYVCTKDKMNQFLPYLMTVTDTVTETLCM
jgi:hypothetical protein